MASTINPESVAVNGVRFGPTDMAQRGWVALGVILDLPAFDTGVESITVGPTPLTVAGGDTAATCTSGAPRFTMLEGVQAATIVQGDMCCATVVGATARTVTSGGVLGSRTAGTTPNSITMTTGPCCTTTIGPDGETET